MVEPGRVAVMLILGAGLGVVHFAGLWLTLRHLPDATSRPLLLVASACARIGLLVVLLVFLTGGRWHHLLPCLLGLLLARQLVVHRVRRGLADRSGMDRQEPEIGRAAAGGEGGPS
jgi:F1F0 ATPase subunit 2